MHLSKFNPRGGRPGIPRRFDILAYFHVNFPGHGPNVGVETSSLGDKRVIKYV